MDLSVTEAVLFIPTLVIKVLTLSFNLLSSNEIFTTASLCFPVAPCTSISKPLPIPCPKLFFRTNESVNKVGLSQALVQL